MLAKTLAVGAVTQTADLLSASLSFSGDDVVSLICRVPGEDGGYSTELFFDTIGKVRERKVWEQDDVVKKNKTLRRKVGVVQGDNNPRGDFDPSV